MKYTENGDTITLEMDREDYLLLLFLLGIAVGKNGGTDPARFWEWVDFVNRINTGNPNFLPYTIPDEYKKKSDV
jgi:hypothetical protein